ncbi:putative alcohol dehydrogenase GroES domain protein (plasmid) [Streptomyces sp. Tu6071]|nr:putative alcohol dehydrogenase GroES domain protein [Streptomyces sp. Tu6071]
MSCGGGAAGEDLFVRYSVPRGRARTTAGTGPANVKAYNRQLWALIAQGKAKLAWIVFQELSLDRAPSLPAPSATERAVGPRSSSLIDGS